MEPTEKFDAIAERSRIILRVRTFFLHADGRPAFLVPNALVKNLPDQPTQAVCDGTDGLSVSKAWDEAAIHVGEDCARRLLHAAGADTRQDQRRTLRLDPRLTRAVSPRRARRTTAQLPAQSQTAVAGARNH